MSGKGSLHPQKMLGMELLSWNPGEQGPLPQQLTSAPSISGNGSGGQGTISPRWCPLYPSRLWRQGDTRNRSTAGDNSIPCFLQINKKCSIFKFVLLACSGTLGQPGHLPRPWLAHIIYCWIMNATRERALLLHASLTTSWLTEHHRASSSIYDARIHY